MIDKQNRKQILIDANKNVVGSGKNEMAYSWEDEETFLGGRSNA